MTMPNSNNSTQSSAEGQDSDKPQKPQAPLPVLDCRGCGVCCFHMGYPAFNLPNDHLEKLAADIPLSKAETSQLGPAAKADLERWVRMPEELRRELLKEIRSYQPEDGELDPVCIWLDPVTRLCKHHEHRPQVCRDFDIGCRQCVAWRRVYQQEITSLS